MSLYQIIEAFNNHSASDELFKTLAVYTAKLTKTNTSFFLLSETKAEPDLLTSNRELKPHEKTEILNLLNKFNMGESNTKLKRGAV